MAKSFDKYERKRKGDKGKGTKELYGKNTPRGLRIIMEKQSNIDKNNIVKSNIKPNNKTNIKTKDT